MKEGLFAPDNLKVLIPAVLTALAAIVTAFFGITKFSAQQRQANRQPFLQKQMDLCFQAAEAASSLASETDPAEWEKCRIAFWRLYWGPLSIVEDPAVEEAMVRLGDLVPTRPVVSPNLPATELGIPSLKLAHACRDLVLKSWNVDLPNLQRAKEKG